MKTHISRRMLAATLGFAILGTVTAAHATHVVCAVLYADASFGGDQLTVENNQSIPNFTTRFNDKASSIRTFDNCFCVSYADANYGGTQGYWGNNQDIPNLGAVSPGYNDNISSITCYIP